MPVVSLTYCIKTLKSEGYGYAQGRAQGSHMKINLSEITEEGRTYTFDRSTGELNEALADLVEQRPYSVEFTIRPLGNAYELRGLAKTNTSDLCSKCGWDIEIPLNTKFNEILMRNEVEYRKQQSTTGNHSVDFLSDGPTVTYFEGESFDAGEFVHEAIAASIPFYPTCGVEECVHLEDVRRKQAELEAEYRKAEEVRTGHPAFSALKDLIKN
jgi:uncharacterized protein